MKIVKKKDRLWPTELGGLVLETLKLLKKKGSKEERDSYIADIKLKESVCNNCGVSTPTVTCESYSVCAYCYKEKTDKLF